MLNRAILIVGMSATALMATGCSQPPATPAAVIEDKIYAVQPDTMKVVAGIIAGEVTEMKVTERIEKGTTKVVSPAKLTGKLMLKNGSSNQTVRLVSGTIRYIDLDGNAIEVEDKRTETAVKFANYGSSERLDPGQDTNQSLNVDFPADALKSRRLKEIRLELAYIPSAFKEETLKFNVSISAQP